MPTVDNVPSIPDWEARIDAYRAAHPDARALDIARAIGCDEATALAALSTHALTLPLVARDDVLDTLRTWGQVMVLIRNGNAVAEVTVPGIAWTISERGWLNWLASGYEVHIRLTALTRILALIRPARSGSLTHSFNFVDEEGRVFCRFYTRADADRERFLAFCARYAADDADWPTTITN